MKGNRCREGGLSGGEEGERGVDLVVERCLKCEASLAIGPSFVTFRACL